MHTSAKARLTSVSVLPVALLRLRFSMFADTVLVTNVCIIIIIIIIIIISPTVCRGPVT